MPKKIKYESGVHHFFRAARRYCDRLAQLDPIAAAELASWVAELQTSYAHSTFRILWRRPTHGSIVVPLHEVRFYVRGDLGLDATVRSTPTNRGKEGEHGDPAEEANAVFFDQQFSCLLEASGFGAATPSMKSRHGTEVTDIAERRRKHQEAAFHDKWASTANVQQIDVRRVNEACTAPEMRYIRQLLGDLRGRSVLDVGCGLGEASVYFALEGADVTASDISAGMLEAAQTLAAANGVVIKTLLSESEELELAADGTFDVVYVGNALHHVDIGQTMPRLVNLLKPGGVFVSWDPLRYNPIINVYRMLATHVRTADEHPLTGFDIRLIRSYLAESRVRYFWLTTLVIFVTMAVVQFRNPNKERFWKKVVEESDRWAWIYRPLEFLDRSLLQVMPWLGLLCWNVVIYGRRPDAGMRGSL